MNPTNLPDSIFELSDHSDEESYYPMGIYFSLEDAIKDASEGDEPVNEFDSDVVISEVRERKIGWGGWSNIGKIRATITWENTYDEATDESKWSKKVEIKEEAK